MQIRKWPHFGILGSHLILLAQERQGFVFVLLKTPNNGVFSVLGGTLSVTNFLVTDFLIGPRIVSHGKFAVINF